MSFKDLNRRGYFVARPFFSAEVLGVVLKNRCICCLELRYFSLACDLQNISLKMHPWQSGATTMTQYSDHHTAPAPPSIDGPAVSADEVGAAFAFQYFKIMKTRPDDLFRFYNNESKVSRGMPSSNGTVDVRHAIGPSRIRELLRKEHSCGTRLALAIINNIEAQESSAGAVIVQVTTFLRISVDILSTCSLSDNWHAEVRG